MGEAVAITTKRDRSIFHEVYKLATVIGIKGYESFFQKLREADTPENGDILFNAVYEMRSIMDNDEKNPTPYHLNYVSSGQFCYSVFFYKNGDAYDYCEYDTKEEAEEAVAKAVDSGDADNGIIDKTDKYEYWAVLNADNRNSFRRLFPTKISALIFLYENTDVPMYKAYIENGHCIISSHLETEEEAAQEEKEGGKNE